MMKKVKSLCCIVALFATTMLTNTNMQAQVTIGSEVKPAKAALLDIKTNEAASAGDATTDKGGILMPRVRLAALDKLDPFIDDSDPNINNEKLHHRGLIVYNLADTNGLAQGPYSWDGSQWLPFAGAGGIAYTGTSPVTVTGNTIGLTDGTASGQVLKWDGSRWTAGTDANDNTTYSGSTSVTLSGTSFQRAALSGDVTAAANSNATTIANNAVTSAKIADGNVALADLASNSVNSAKIVDGTVALADLASNSVNSAKIVDASVATADLANNAVTSVKIADGTVALADMASNSVNSAKIVDNSITQSDIQNAGNAGEVLMSNGTGANAAWTPLVAVPGAGSSLYAAGSLSPNASLACPAGSYGYVYGNIAGPVTVRLTYVDNNNLYDSWFVAFKSAGTLKNIGTTSMTYIIFK